MLDGLFAEACDSRGLIRESVETQGLDGRLGSDGTGSVPLALCPQFKGARAIGCCDDCCVLLKIPTDIVRLEIAVEKAAAKVGRLGEDKRFDVQRARAEESHDSVGVAFDRLVKAELEHNGLEHPFAIDIDALVLPVRRCVVLHKEEHLCFRAKAICENEKVVLSLPDVQTADDHLQFVAVKRYAHAAFRDVLWRLRKTPVFLIIGTGEFNGRCAARDK